MRIAALLVAAVALGGARVARTAATLARGADSERVEEPYAPTASAAPFVSLGFREALADLLFVRLRGYFGGYYGTTANGIISLGEAITALDPQFRRVYELAANATTMAESGLDNSTSLRAIALLENGMRAFPDEWNLPYLAGQIYLQDLKTDDPVQRRAWDERGVLLVESAIRKPGAPQGAAVWAAHIRTKLGQRERAIEGVRELLLLTQDAAVRKALLERLAKLENADSTELAAELLGARKQFETLWRAERPSVNASMYLLIGPRLSLAFDPIDLAMGGRDLVINESYERLEPLE